MKTVDYDNYPQNNEPTINPIGAPRSQTISDMQREREQQQNSSNFDTQMANNVHSIEKTNTFANKRNTTQPEDNLTEMA